MWSLLWMTKFSNIYEMMLKIWWNFAIESSVHCNAYTFFFSEFRISNDFQISELQTTYALQVICLWQIPFNTNRFKLRHFMTFHLCHNYNYFPELFFSFRYKWMRERDSHVWQTTGCFNVQQHHWILYL